MSLSRNFRGMRIQQFQFLCLKSSLSCGNERLRWRIMTLEIIIRGSRDGHTSWVQPTHDLLVLALNNKARL